MKKHTSLFLNLIATLFVFIGSLGNALQEDLSVIFQQSDVNSELCTKPFITGLDFNQFPNYLEEPPILALGIQKGAFPINCSPRCKPVLIHASMDIYEMITTKRAEEIFKINPDGIEVQEPGLYRISYYQKFYTEPAEKTWIEVLLFAADHKYRHYSYRIDPHTKTEHEIDFNQIVRVSANQTIQIFITPQLGTATFSSFIDSSCLVIEKIDN